MRSAGSRLTLAFTGVVLAACAGAPFKPTEVNAFGTPYEALTESSYGPLSTGRFRYCDPADDYSNNPNLSTGARDTLGDATHGIAGAITGVLGAPVQGLTKIDAGIVDLRLAGHFKVPSDSNHPAVAVLGHTPEGIVVWHSAKMVRLYEVTAAAQAFCDRQQRVAVYRGSASRCPPVERGLQGMAVVPTYAISAYACSRRP